MTTPVAWECKHTPGPWYRFNKTKFRPKTGYSYVIATCKDDEVRCIARVEMLDAETRTANADLIAAAPEMLEALKECEVVLTRLDTLRHIEPQFPALDAARAAIAKAEGRKP